MAEDDKSSRNNHPKSEEMRGKRVRNESPEHGRLEYCGNALLAQHDQQYHEREKRREASYECKGREKAHLQEHRPRHQEEQKQPRHGRARITKSKDALDASNKGATFAL